MSIRSLLDEEIRNELGEIKKMEVGSEGHEKAVNSLVKLVDRSIEMEKMDIDIDEKDKDRENDVDLKLRAIEEDRKDRKIKNYIAVLGIIIPSAITVWGAIKSIEFEKEGTFTTIMGRGFISKLLPKK